MARKKNGQYRRVEQKTPLVPARTPGNHPLPQEQQDATPVLDRLIVPGRQPVATRVMERRITQQTFDGPLPHPEIFKQYGQVIKNAPERILKVFEEDSAHIRHMQREALTAHREDNRRVQWMAFALIAGGYAMAMLFAYIKEPVLAGIVLTTTIIGTVVGFLQNRQGKDSSSDSKDSATKQDSSEAPTLGVEDGSS